MDCLGKNIASTDAYQAGRSINFVEYNQPCREQAQFSFETANDLELRLFQRVQRRDRVIRVPLGTSIAYEFDRGLLGARYF